MMLPCSATPGGTTPWAVSSIPGARARGGGSHSTLSSTTAQPFAEGHTTALAHGEFSICKIKPWGYCKEDE